MNKMLFNRHEEVKVLHSLYVAASEWNAGKFTIRCLFRPGGAILSWRTRAMAPSVSVLGRRRSRWITRGSRPATCHASASGLASSSARQILPLTKSRTESSRTAHASGEKEEMFKLKVLYSPHQAYTLNNKSILNFNLVSIPIQPHMSMTHPAAAIHPTSMHVSAGMPPRHFLPSPTLASPVGSQTGGSQPPPNPPLAANAPCSTLFVANLGQFVSEHELKEMFAR